MNKGFTLIELISVITIIGLLAIITTPAYETISKSIKKENYNSKKNTIKAQSINYVERYLKNEVYDGTRTTKKSNNLCFSVQYLIRSGIISSDSDKEEYIENNETGEKYYATNATDKEKKFVIVYYDDDSSSSSYLKLKAVFNDEGAEYDSRSNSCSLLLY